ncbi:MAG: hypothetical protein VR64_11985 [Desulfatitalea sp. BRH_c12]|nr:MAG: hypothetical protein VR64_11985 [Desulfatitalea sp. BRH_c12]
MKPVKILLVGLAAIALFTGCATTGVHPWTENLMGTKYRKATVDNKQTYFRQIWAVEDNGELRISGYLRLKGMHGFRVPDYVEVALITPGGDPMAAQKVLYYPRSLYGRKSHREGRFVATFALIPPEGTTVRLENVN